MKRIFLALFLIFVCISTAHAKSYICRSDGSVQAFESDEEVQLTRPLQQNGVEEVALPSENEAAQHTETVQKQTERVQPKRSEFVPLTQKDIEERGRTGEKW